MNRRFACCFALVVASAGCSGAQRGAASGSRTVNYESFADDQACSGGNAAGALETAVAVQDEVSLEPTDNPAVLRGTVQQHVDSCGGEACDCQVQKEITQTPNGDPDNPGTVSSARLVATCRDGSTCSGTAQVI